MYIIFTDLVSLDSMDTTTVQDIDALLAEVTKDKPQTMDVIATFALPTDVKDNEELKVGTTRV